MHDVVLWRIWCVSIRTLFAMAALLIWTDGGSEGEGEGAGEGEGEGEWERAVAGWEQEQR